MPCVVMLSLVRVGEQNAYATYSNIRFGEIGTTEGRRRWSNLPPHRPVETPSLPPHHPVETRSLPPYHRPSR
jgi:hypothetical protein